MSVNRLVVGALSASLLSLVPVGLTAGTALAAFSDDTGISRARAQFGDDFHISGSVVDATGSTCTGGTVTLHRIQGGTTEPVQVAQDPDGGSFWFDLTALSNATYVLDYAGNGTVGCPAEQGGVVQQVVRRMSTDVNQRLVFRGKIAPAWKRKPVVVQVKKNGRWATYAKVRTNRRSVWSTKLYTRPGGARTYFRAFVKGTPTFQKSFTDVWYTYRFRQAPTSRTVAR